MLRIMTQMPVKSKFSESLGDTRFLSVDLEKDVTIADHENRGKRTLLTVPRWVRLVEQMDQIDSAVERAATLKPTQYRFHLGADWHISVSDALPFVDIRCWYQKGSEVNLRPTLVGIVLTFAQWNCLREVAKLDIMVKELEEVESCWHLSSQDEALCPECTTPTAASRAYVYELSFGSLLPRTFVYKKQSL